MIKRCFAIFAVILASAYCGVLVSAQRPALRYTFSPEGYHLHRVKRADLPDSSREFIISETTYDNGIDLLSDLTLSFNSEDMLSTDDSGRYRIRYANYTPYTSFDAAGEGAAYFYRQEDYVILESVPGGWSTNSDDLGSFSIEFRMKPSALTEGAVIFSRKGYAGKSENGIVIQLSEAQLQVLCSNMFYDRKGKPFSHSFAVPGKIAKDTWYHALLSFDRLTGLMKFFLNSKEVYSSYLTEDGTENTTVLIPRFAPKDVPDIVIGKNYSGALDEFRISYKRAEDLAILQNIAGKKYIDVKNNSRIPVNSEGVVTSAVYEFPHTGTMLKKMEWKEKLPPETFIWFEIRIDDSRFGQFHTSPRWYRIDNNQRNIYLHKEGEEYLRGRYMQWRAHLISSPDGKLSPRLGDVKIEFELDEPPVVPLDLSIVETGDRYVILRWKKNVDHDIGGYYIYYGIRSGEYEGKIRMINEVPITNNEDEYIQVKITNDIVEQNKKTDKSYILTYPLLKNNVLYYFSVTAYDTYRQGTQFNHESDHSPEASARPFAGTEIQPE